MAGAASGVAVGDNCVDTFLALKKSRSHQYVIYKIDMAAGQVVIDTIGDRGASYDEFTGYLLKEAPQDCRYAVYDYEFTDGEGCQKSKIVFIAWSPDDSKVKNKMLYAASKDKFRQGLDGVQIEMQATDASEIDIKEVQAKIASV